MCVVFQKNGLDLKPAVRSDRWSSCIAKMGVSDLTVVSQPEVFISASSWESKQKLQGAPNCPYSAKAWGKNSRVTAAKVGYQIFSNPEFPLFGDLCLVFYHQVWSPGRCFDDTAGETIPFILKTKRGFQRENKYLITENTNCSSKGLLQNTE